MPSAVSRLLASLLLAICSPVRAGLTWSTAGGSPQRTQAAPAGTALLSTDGSIAWRWASGNFSRHVASVVTLARHMQLNVVAEGIETAAQAQAVTELGCGFGQGFLFSRPLPPVAAAAFARAHPLGTHRPFGGNGT